MGYFAIIIGAYLIGSSNMAYYLSKYQNKDVRSAGSGNLGTSNAVILLGWGAGVLVAIHDIGKAILAVLLTNWLFPGLEFAGAVAGVSCVLGHIFPFYLRFRGGKGFASFLGMTIGLNWKLALVVLIMVVVVTLVTNYIVAATVTTVVTVPVAMGIMYGSWILALVLCVAAGVILYKHRENFVRIYKGTEIKFFSAAKGEHKMK